MKIIIRFALGKLSDGSDWSASASHSLYINTFKCTYTNVVLSQAIVQKKKYCNGMCKEKEKKKHLTEKHQLLHYHTNVNIICRRTSHAIITSIFYTFALIFEFIKKKKKKRTTKMRK